MSEPSDSDYAIAMKFLDCEREAAVHMARILAAVRRQAIEECARIAADHASHAKEDRSVWAAEAIAGEILALLKEPKP